MGREIPEDISIEAFQELSAQAMFVRSLAVDVYAEAIAKAFEGKK